MNSSIEILLIDCSRFYPTLSNPSDPLEALNERFFLFIAEHIRSIERFDDIFPCFLRKLGFDHFSDDYGCYVKRCALWRDITIFKIACDRVFDPDTQGGVNPNTKQCGGTEARTTLWSSTRKT